MTSYEIISFRNHLKEKDPKNNEARRGLHENYEWLEGYWKSNLRIRNFDRFCTLIGEWIWINVPSIKRLSNILAAYSPIGDSTKEDYSPNNNVNRATSLLQSGNGSAGQNFNSVMILVKQIRNNLFHGMKLELADQQAYQRNKLLVKLARDITEEILRHLIQAEESKGLYY